MSEPQSPEETRRLLDDAMKEDEEMRFHRYPNVEARRREAGLSPSQDDKEASEL